MKAAVLEARGAEGLKVIDVPDPVRAPGEAVMKVHASSLNRVDIYMRDVGQGISHALPIILGVDGVGEIVECDRESPLRAGQRVMLFATNFCRRCDYCLSGDQPLCIHARIAGEHRNGCYAEYVSMPDYCFLSLPDNLSYEHAGVLPAAYVTAYRMLFGKRCLEPGETVLVVGAGGGVAVACIQLAKLAGAHVFVTTSSSEKLKKAIAAGADDGVDYTSEAVSARILELTAGRGVDMVVDSVGEASWSESLRSLRRGGRIVTCGATTGGNPSAELQRMFIRQLELYGSTGGSLNEARKLLSLAGSREIEPVIDSRFSLDEIGAAFERLQAPDRFGKVALCVGGQTG
ncbi:zinc-binding dehydrogenase [Henriciella aquimarina]|uniref:zinc-binding dehydrogenase n=1 Tax=Henriciella aquimarina TaxID=545261 RepID=UPI001301C3EF|nr:zinc-binding dehydrogenase [Henriciella aquimarina]